MAYSINPNLPKARAIAMQLLVREQMPVQTVANRCGVHRSTIYRWKRKWDVLNQYVQMDNPNRPNRIYSRSNHLARCTWRIPTDSAKPHTNPTAVSEELTQLVLAVRAQLKRCAEVVWHHLVTVLSVSVSLSSVRRILWRSGVARGRKNRVRRDNLCGHTLPHRANWCRPTPFTTSIQPVANGCITTPSLISIAAWHMPAWRRSSAQA